MVTGQEAIISSFDSSTSTLKVLVNTQDIEIGAVEIKDATTDTRAVVDATYGLAVDIKRTALPSTVYNGKKTVTAAGTAEALGSSQALTRGIRVKALAANTNDVYVGDSGVDSTNGFVLDATDEVFIEVDNLATVYVDVDTSGEGVTYIAS